MQLAGLSSASINHQGVSKYTNNSTGRMASTIKSITCPSSRKEAEDLEKWLEIMIKGIQNSQPNSMDETME